MKKLISGPFSRTHLAILVIAGAVGAAASTAYFWFERPASAIEVSFATTDISLPSEWRTELKSRSLQLLTINVDNVWRKRVAIDRIVVSGVRELNSVTVRLGPYIEPADTKWTTEEHESGRFRIAHITGLPQLLPPNDKMQVFLWGDFSRYPFLEVSVIVGDAELKAALEEPYPPLLAFIARNLIWFAIIIISAVVGGGLMYIDKQKDVASS